MTAGGLRLGLVFARRCKAKVMQSINGGQAALVGLGVDA